jgi:hypothetical protein
VREGITSAAVVLARWDRKGKGGRREREVFCFKLLFKSQMQIDGGIWVVLLGRAKAIDRFYLLCACT